jgi:hypothetical protein
MTDLEKAALAQAEAQAKAAADARAKAEAEAKAKDAAAKAYPEGTVFVCFEECFTKGIRWHVGQTQAGTVCPPHFKVKPKEEPKGKRK